MPLRARADEWVDCGKLFLWRQRDLCFRTLRGINRKQKRDDRRQKTKGDDVTRKAGDPHEPYYVRILGVQAIVTVWK